MDESSPSRLAGLEESHSLDAGKVGGGTGGTTEVLGCPVTFLSLPDDLIYLVFEQLFADVFQKGRTTGQAAKPAHAVLVNKRLYRLCAPLLYRDLNVRSRKGRTTEQGIQSLLEQRNRLKLVKRLVMSVEPETSTLCATFLALLPNLTSLTLHFHGRGATITPTLLGSLRGLQDLRSLSILGKVVMDDHSFSLANDMPFLKHLESDSVTVLQQLVDSDARDLCTLTIRSEDEVQMERLPWMSLEHLRLYPEYGVSMMDSSWLGHLEEMQRLSINFSVLEYGEFGDDDFALPGLCRLLPLLDCLERLDLEDVNRVDLPPEFQQSTLRILSLRGELLLYQTNNLFHLERFLRSFTRLTTLLIEGFNFVHTCDSSAEMLAEEDPDEIYLRYPPLGALIRACEALPLLEVRWRSLGETSEMRWTRESRDDVFASELWSVGSRRGYGLVSL
ncbi:hypothetical protein JCM10207_003838 [Rhodosporidiobolus poonsookiae]